MVAPGERVNQKGLIFAATPASDFVCGTLQLASGMTLHVFTTGRGTPYGLAAVPVIKVSTRSKLKQRWHDLIDVDAGSIATGDATIEDVGWELFRLMLDVASGRETWAEHWKLTIRLRCSIPARSPNDRAAPNHGEAASAMSRPKHGPGRDQLFDLRYRMRRQLLRNLADDPVRHLGMKCFAQAAENLRRRDDDELVETIVVGMTVERFRDLSGEALLGDVVPVNLLDRASRRTDARNGAPRAVGALFARCRIVLRHDLLDFELDLVRGAFVAQKERLLAVADQNERIVGGGGGANSFVINSCLQLGQRLQSQRGCLCDDDAHPRFFSAPQPPPSYSLTDGTPVSLCSRPGTKARAVL